MMIKYYRFLLALVFFFSALTQLQAQIRTGRNLQAIPLSDTVIKEGFFQNSAFSGAITRGFNSAFGEQAWNIKHYALFELYRWNDALLAFTTGQELRANPHNPINFNPRNIVWNESLIFYLKRSNVQWELGFNHRCKHDIDNASSPRDEEPASDYQPRFRTLVLSGLHLAATSQQIHLVSELNFRYYGRLDYYGYNWERREPESDQSLNWENLRMTAKLGGKLSYPLSEELTIYNRDWLSFNYFDQAGLFKPNARLEGGFRASDGKASFNMFAAYEHFFDDTSRPYPVQSDVVFIGIRGNHELFF